MSTVVRALRQYVQPREAGYAGIEVSADEQKQDWTDPPAPSSPVVVRRALLVVLAVAALLSLPLQAYVGLRSPAANVQLEPPRASATRKVVIRTVRDNGSGIGSVVHQLTRATVFADAFGAELYAPESGLVRHGYDTVSILNTFRKTRLDGVDFGRVCTLSHYMSPEAYRDFTDAVCKATMLGLGVDSVHPADLAKANGMVDCGVILNDMPWEFNPQLSQCTWQSTTRQMGSPKTRVVSQKVAVGLHIRWGDMVRQVLKGGRDDRSIPIPMANGILRGLKECLGPLSVTVFMEKHSDAVLRKLGVKDFTLVDTGDDMADLVTLAEQEILIVSGSAYTSMAHQAARGGLTIVPDYDSTERWWRTTGTNAVAPWQEIANSTRNCAAIREMYAAGKERGRVEQARVPSTVFVGSTSMG